AGLRALVRECQSDARPEHRRLRRDRAVASCSNRRGRVTLAVRVVGNHHEYAARKAINLVNEIFLDYLNAGHPQYLAEQFQIPEE
ncbi:MAG: hypothetical protein ACRD96_08170, partial [Bryobacteraceae bacterium]